ncbi:MAG: Uma2 family endonuclease [Cyanobacteriota bacterium]|jgi:Uma2 family endonuclease
MTQTSPPLSPRQTLPTMYDLPSEEIGDPGVPDEFHVFQPELLRQTFRPPAYDPQEVFVAADLNLYYDLRQPQWYKRPDWFAVLGLPRLYDKTELRLSYVRWQEGVDPFVVVELLSPGTEKEDLGQTLREVSQPPNKWTVYEQILKVPYYFVYDRYRDSLQAFGLMMSRYQPLPIEGQGVWLPEAQLGLGLWQGRYQGIERRWLRWYDERGHWLPTPEEAERQQVEEERLRAEAEKQRAEQERLRAEAEKQRADSAEAELQRLRRLLAEAGVNPESVS